jgi:uncharacterized protein YciI
MPYVIQLKDKAGASEVRAKVRDEHVAYLKANQAKLLAAGAITDDDGTGGNGGVIILDTDDRAEAQAFIDNDPFAKAGLFESIAINRWRKAFFDREFCL